MSTRFPSQLSRRNLVQLLGRLHKKNNRKSAECGWPMRKLAGIVCCAAVLILLATLAGRDKQQVNRSGKRNELLGHYYVTFCLSSNAAAVPRSVARRCQVRLPGSSRLFHVSKCPSSGCHWQHHSGRIRFAVKLHSAN